MKQFRYHYCYKSIYWKYCPVMSKPFMQDFASTPSKSAFGKAHFYPCSLPWFTVYADIGIMKPCRMFHNR